MRDKICAGDFLKSQQYEIHNGTDVLQAKELYAISFNSDIERTIINNYCGSAYSFKGLTEYYITLQVNNSYIDPNKTYQLYVWFLTAQRGILDIQGQMLKLTY